MRQRPPPPPNGGLGPLEIEGQRPEPTFDQFDHIDTPISRLNRKMIAALILVAALYGLHASRFLHVLILSKGVNRVALNIAILSSTVVVGLWGYLDIYRSTLQKKKVDYGTARTTTHAILISMIITFVSSLVALWPVYHAGTLVLLLAFYYGVLFQILVLLPAKIANPIIFCIYSFFVYFYTQGTTPWP